MSVCGALPRRLAATAVAAAFGLAVAAHGAAAQEPSVDEGPRITTPPSIAGTAALGSTLEAVGAEWQPRNAVPRFAWIRCDPTLTACEPVAGATSSRYVVAEADEGRRLAVVVTVSHEGTDSPPSRSEPTAVVPYRRPALVLDPVVSGTLREGELLVTDVGEWTGSDPLLFSTHWQRCDVAGGCADITGATEPAYRLVAADVGYALRSRIVASGPGGTASATSALTPAVTAAPSASPPASPPPVPSPQSTALVSSGTSSGALGAAPSALVPSALVPSAGSGPARRYLSPWPRVRFVGVVTGRRTRLTLVSVQGFAGMRVSVRCSRVRGGCPYRSTTFTARRRTVRIRRLERVLRAGAVVEVFVTGRGVIGKYARVRMRTGKPPDRRDRCVAAGTRRVRSCDTG